MLLLISNEYFPGGQTVQVPSDILASPGGQPSKISDP